MRVPFRLAIAAVALGAAGACGDRGTSTVAAAPQPAPRASVAAATTGTASAPVLARDLQEIVDRFRKIVVLVEDQSGFDTAARGRESAARRWRLNRCPTIHRRSHCTAACASGAAKGPVATPYPLSIEVRSELLHALRGD